MLLVFAPLGLYYCYKKPTNSRLFVAIFGVCSVYFSCVMVRLLLLSSPALCLLSGIGVSEILHFFVKQFKNYNETYDSETAEGQPNPPQTQTQQAGQRRAGTPAQSQANASSSQQNQKEKKVYRYSFELVIVIIFILITMLVSYVLH